MVDLSQIGNEGAAVPEVRAGPFALSSEANL